MLYGTHFWPLYEAALEHPIVHAFEHALYLGSGLEEVAGKLGFQTHCASCHGVNLRGGANAPTLRGVGAADLDFHMVTGRMPAALPWIQAGDLGQQISTREIRAIEAYVTYVAPGGPPIPEVAAGGELTHGRALSRRTASIVMG